MIPFPLYQDSLSDSDTVNSTGKPISTRRLDNEITVIEII